MNFKLKALWSLLTLGLFLMGIYNGLHPDQEYKAPLITSSEIRVLATDNNLIPQDFSSQISKELGFTIQFYQLANMEESDIQIALTDGPDLIWTTLQNAERMHKQNLLTSFTELNELIDSLHTDFKSSKWTSYFLPLLWDKTVQPAQIYGFSRGQNQKNNSQVNQFLKIIFRPDWSFALSKMTSKGNTLLESDKSNLDYHLRASRLRDKF